jgi:hypothetical protein
LFKLQTQEEIYLKTILILLFQEEALAYLMAVLEMEMNLQMDSLNLISLIQPGDKGMEEFPVKTNVKDYLHNFKEDATLDLMK